MRAYEVLSLEPHFDPDLRFRQYEADPITGALVQHSALYMSRSLIYSTQILTVYVQARRCCG